MPTETEKSKFSIQLGNWQFMPGLKLTLITLILLPILVYLGMWQLEKSHQKEKNISDLNYNSVQSAINLSQISEPNLAKHRYVPVKIDGIFLNQYNFLLDNQMYEHKPGYRVLTIVSTPQISKWILIDRGWVPIGPNRTQLPTIDHIFGLREIHGVIETIGTGIELKSPKVSPEAAWPVVLSTLNYDFIAKTINHPVYEFVIRLTDDQITHYVYPQAHKGISIEKHMGYAIQWFIFAFLLVLYYLIVSTKRGAK